MLGSLLRPVRRFAASRPSRGRTSKTLRLVAPGALLLWLAAAPGFSQEPPEEHAPKHHHHEVEIPGVEVDPSFIEFGTLYVGEEPVHNVRVTNTGNVPLIIKNIFSSCGCAVPRVIFADGREVPVAVESAREQIGTIAPGESAAIEVRFVTHGYSGYLLKDIRVEIEHPEQEGFKICVEARVVEGLVLDPKILDFGDIVRGRRTEQELDVLSKGIGSFSVARIENLPHYMRYSAEPAPDLARARDSDSAVRMKLWVEGDVPLGESKMYLVASVAHERIKSIRIPVRMNVQPKVVFKINDQQVGSNLDFGVFPRDQGKVLEVEIVNLLPAIPYNVLDLSVEGALRDAVDVSLHPLEAGVRYLLRVQLKPGVPAGYARATVTLISDHPDMISKKIRLLGYAVGSS